MDRYIYNDFKQTQKLAEKAKTYGVSMLEATLTGGVHALQNNNMVCLAGGDKKIFNNWEYILRLSINLSFFHVFTFLGEQDNKNLPIF